MFFWQKKIRRAESLADAGRLHEAVAWVLRHTLHQAPVGNRLTASLLERLRGAARESAAAGDFSTAWQHLVDAERLSDEPRQWDLVADRQRLLEQSLEAAEQHLAAGRLLRAHQVLEPLRQQHILDTRADSIQRLVQQIESAEASAAAGQWRQAQEKVDAVLLRRPDLTWLAHRRDALAHERQACGGLTGQLQSAILQSRWSTAQRVSAEMLSLAPYHPIAASALRRSVKCRSEGKRELAAEAALPPSTHHTEMPVPTDYGQPEPPRPRLMLWVDGVGGYLICTSPTVLIGRAVTDAGVDIPLLADLHRRHAKLVRQKNEYLLEPLGGIRIDDRPAANVHWLRDGQKLRLGDAVVLTYRRPHPLSSSARLDLSSRHRTQPLSDAILLMSDTLVIGSSPASHIVCPGLDHEVVLFFREGVWHCRGVGSLETGDRVFQGEAPLACGQQLRGEGFSLTLETV